MSYCYVSDQTKSQQYYRHLMPESPLEQNSPTTSHVRFVLLFFPHVCTYVYVCKMNDVWRIAKRELLPPSLSFFEKFVQFNNEYIEVKQKKNPDPLACHHFFNLCYALMDRWIDRLSVCVYV
jgi:hypothetical protein